MPVSGRRKPGRRVKDSRKRGGRPEPSESEEKGGWILARRKEGRTPGSEGGGRSPARSGPGRLPVGASPGRGAEGSGHAVLRRPPVYLPIVSGATSFPILRSRQITISPHVTATPRYPRSPGHGSVAANPSVSPAHLRAHRACALRSCLLSSAEAAAASAFRSHGVSNRSSLRLQLPFPPFRSSRPSRLGLGRGWGDESEGSRSRRRRRGKTSVGARPSMRTGPDGGEGYSTRECWGLKMVCLRLRRHTSPQRGFFFPGTIMSSRRRSCALAHHSPY